MAGGSDRRPPPPPAVIAYLIRRLMAAVLLLLIVSVVTFGIFFLVPRLAGQTPEQLAAEFVGRSPRPEQIHAVEVKFGFDQPLYVQYGRFIKAVVAGADYNSGPGIVHCPAPCFGVSSRNQQLVLPQMLSALPVTVSLAIGAAVVWLLAGVAIGVLSALRRGSIFDRSAMTLALAGVSLPIFFTALVSLAFFRDGIPLFPDAGSYIPITEDPVRWFEALVLPWVTLAFLYAALYARLTRAGMLETMNEDFIRTARAKGLRERSVVTKHGLRATLTPIVTIFGMDIGQLLGGAVLTETAFSLPGLGHFAIDAITNNDLPEILGVTMLAGLFIVIANLIVDILYGVIDPRVRYS